MNNDEWLQKAGNMKHSSEHESCQGNDFAGKLERQKYTK